MSVHEPFFLCITILHLHDFLITVLMYLVLGQCISCRSLMIRAVRRASRAVADVRLEPSVLWAFARTATGSRRVLPL